MIRGTYWLQASIKPLVYGVNLLLESPLLNNLVETVTHSQRRSPGTQTWKQKSFNLGNGTQLNAEIARVPPDPPAPALHVEPSNETSSALFGMGIYPFFNPPCNPFVLEWL
jgi:hypothetical protein